jgi:hypothetical protein
LRQSQSPSPSPCNKPNPKCKLKKLNPSLWRRRTGCSALLANPANPLKVKIFQFTFLRVRKNQMKIWMTL